MIRKAVILSAGKGTRFHPYTKYIAKEMLPIVDMPAAQLIIDEVINSGITDIAIITNKTKIAANEFYKAYALEKEISIQLIYQEILNGTGAATLLAEDFVKGEAFALLNGDDLIYTGDYVPVTKQLMDYYNDREKDIIGVQDVGRENISKYGAIDIVKGDGDGYNIKGIVEKPQPDEAPSYISSLGRYIITPKLLEYLKITKPGNKGEIVLTDALNMRAKEEGIFAYCFKGRRYDLGNKEGYAEAVTEYVLRRDETKERYREFIINTAKKLLNYN